MSSESSTLEQIAQSKAILADACAFYQSQLALHPEALSYVQDKRKLSAEMIQNFQL